jgi:2-polyprenyl-6-methoxyphenol hydroxylase-like FAD-dependent oxidoreductase
MAQTIVLGGGLCGLTAAMMLARDGHGVTVLERDPDPVPADPEAAWECWRRDGVAQFRQAHFLQPLGRQVLDAELPDVRQALAEAGALRFTPLAAMPPSIADRTPRPGDERFVTWTGRRSTIEQAIGRAASAEAGVEIRRGVSAAALETRRIDGRVHVTAVRTDDGERLAADLVIDAMGRGSKLPKLLAAAGGDPVHEESEDSGFLYYTRYFRGTLPEPRGALNCPVGSFSILTLPGDAGTWSITLYGSSRDPALKAVRDPARWSALVRACPRHAHWLDGEPITGVMPMGGVLNRVRSLGGNGAGPAIGVVSLGDAWACVNPSTGRGISLGLAHAAVLRRVVRESGDRPVELTAAFAAATEVELVPWYRATVAADNLRLAEIDALRAGATPPPPANPIVGALPAAMSRDPDVFRAGLEILGCLALPQEIFARPGFAQKVLENAGDGPRPSMGPDRAQMLALVG